MFAVAIPLLDDIVIMFSVSVLTIYIFNKIKLPPILGFLLAGILVGPYAFKLIDGLDEVEILAEIGVIFILFSIGLEFSITKLLKMKRNILQGGSMQVFLTIIITMLISSFFFPFNTSLFLGFLAALSSTAIILKLHQSAGTLNSPPGNVSLSILIYQDIIILPMILILPLLSGASGSLSSAIIMFIAKILGIAIFMFVAIKLIMPKLIFYVAKTRIKELFSISVLAICLLMVWIAAQFDISLALGAFLAGLILSETEFNHDALEFIEPFKDIFASFFFISIGMLLNLNYVFENLSIILIISFGLIILKFLIVFFTTLSLGFSGRTSFITGMVLAQVGEFSFVLAKSGFSFNLIDNTLYQTFIASAVITITATPFLFKSAEKFASKFNTQLSKFKKTDKINSEQNIKELQNHLVIIGYGINGKNLTIAAEKANLEYIIVEMNPITVKEEIAKGTPMIYGDATQRAILDHVYIQKAKVCVVAISDPSATREITKTVKSINPAIHLLIRTRFVEEISDLQKLGADEVIPEEFETSIEIFNRILSYYLIPKNKISEITNFIRNDSYQMFREASSSKINNLNLLIPDHEVITCQVAENSKFHKMKILDLDIRNKYEVSLIAIKKKSEILVSNPNPQTVIEVGDVIVLFGKQTNLNKLEDEYQIF